jgi:predicted metal-dependent hydrolase
MRVWFKFLPSLTPRRQDPAGPLRVGSRLVPLLLVRHVRARRYLLRLRPDGTARVTIPRGGTPAEARAFVERNHVWLEAQFKKHQARPQHPVQWLLGSEIFFRGETVRIEAAADGQIRFGSETLKVVDLAADLRPAIEKHLRSLAARELPPRVMAFAAQHQLSLAHVIVRNQKSRWGSCSRHRTLSLNWRLIQTPEFVRDYVILHELAHLRQMNHSDRFWQEVERLCPDYLVAERWLKAHREFLR